MKLETVIKYMQPAEATLDPALLSSEVGSFAIDSREIRPGGMFFALSQPEFKNNCFNGDFADSTRYAAAAFDSGAAACVVRRDRFEEHREVLGKYEKRFVFVDDVIAAFQRLAHGIYEHWGRPVVAITGSAGKTTARELTAHVLTSGGRRVLKNVKNYNNGIGLPLTLMDLASDENYDVAVLEMGMSTPHNEIARLCKIVPPDISVVLNVLPVHVEHLGSIEDVAKAKAEIVEGMKPGGTAVLNADDVRVAEMHWLSKSHSVTFGIQNPADVRAENIRFERFGETKFTLVIGDDRAEVTSSLNGRHNILNSLAAAAVATRFGMSAEDIAVRLNTVAAPAQRGEVLRFADGFTVINDSYNSNPDALMSMINTLIEGSDSSERKIAVVGEMLELGEEEVAMHRAVGARIGDSGIDILIGVRGLASELVDASKVAGLEAAEFAEDSSAAAERVAAIVKPGDVVLVKGSRGVRTEKVIERLLERFELERPQAGARA
ncbi:MAG: UDP-N-acetylmuramoyl-tripeptide--D-alanyl-D-alanine ligase [Acidobacteria bacterium]|nr:UDP-N-acetylmuramoyl-tripeptide--D-alanyl-D-alanine ligase [Acidobacteriota bacterium]